MARRRRPLPPQPQLVGLAVLLSVAVSAAAKTDQPDGEGRQVLSCSSLCERKGIGHGSEHSVQCWFSISVAALNVMFNSMNKPSQLSGWKSSGGDPCGGDEEWKGIQCSGKSVTEMYVIAFNIYLKYYVWRRDMFGKVLRNFFLAMQHTHCSFFFLTILLRAVTCRGLD